MTKPDTSQFDKQLTRAIAGDGAAFDWLFRTYAGRFRAFALARGASDPEAVANDVMLRLFQNIATFDGDEPAFVRWAFTIARNRLIDLHRSESRRPQLSDVEPPIRSVSSAEDQALGRLSEEQLGELLAVLTTEQREVIVLRLVEDLSLDDVASIVGRPVTAVKALQRRGLRALQRQILLRESPNG